MIVTEICVKKIKVKSGEKKIYNHKFIFDISVTTVDAVTTVATVTIVTSVTTFFCRIFLFLSE